ncbi:Ornithine carbamoyltransferase 1, phaseolotoxin-sensitive [Candidatus Tremblaya princeps]|uniref:Ornithine carbamoyltransferase n=1 Tax=Tremblaya princeps TaxID=189385 RepID=A0A143WNG7_TREPR|nr:Ornithine carbamoyltransferase 1, phaseolotoxin-sensitive [Candidatus Tremblaya princeps]
MFCAMTRQPRHFLQLSDLTRREYEGIFDAALRLRGNRRCSWPHKLRNKIAVLLFSKPSTRTRASIEAGVSMRGGASVYLDGRLTQIARGESPEDTAMVLGRYADVIVCRAGSHGILTRLAQSSCVPVVNALSDEYHPCQVASDVFTYADCRGYLDGRVVSWVGDANNMLLSWMQAARLFGFRLNVACPGGNPSTRAMVVGSEGCSYFDDPTEACSDADALCTDTMGSMGYRGASPCHPQCWRVCERALNRARPDAIVMHCLPSYRGVEISGSVADGSRSVVPQEAGNRLHVQQSIIEHLLA